ncbi:TonB-dependent receptor [Sphingomonas sp.]|uniref:TonB-dependent receptor n=1 Tax=Sphingomonas sp. TaxID=28214 RepID=UPI001EC36DF4|nr:TonB-dependent receptor [Sphingomonas sp.]MBX3595102.1 TonB-dependent receptor [Sphingomonas sp.]
MTPHLIALLVASAGGNADPAQETPPVATAEHPRSVPGDSARTVDDVQRATAASDIVVTARRRDEQAQDVPIAISVVGVKELDGSGSFNVARLTQLQPTLQFFSTNPRNSSVNIRGLGAPLGLTNDGIEQGVGIYIDQVYMSRVAIATLDFLDVQQIETLRGPQGTLYGKNTVAGAIGITSKPPSFAFQGRAEASFGNLDFAQFKGSLTGPLSDNVAARLGVAVTSRRGTIHDVATGDDVNSQDNLGLRGAILWRAGDRIDLTLAADYSRQDPKCCAQTFVRVGATQRPLNRQFDALAAAQGYEPPSRDPFDRVTDLDAELRARNVLGGTSLRAEAELGGGKLTSVTAWRFWDWLPANDRDFTGLPITTLSQNPTRQDQFTQEVRYAGQASGFDYVAGIFGFYQNIHTTGTQRQGPAASKWLLAPSDPLSNDPGVLDGLTAVNDIRLRNFSGALFGKFNWNVSDRVTLSPGLRLNYDDKVGDYSSVVRDGQGVLVPTTGGTDRQAAQRGVLRPQSFSGEAYRAWNLSYDVTASVRAARDVLLYATYAHSFKSGGLNLNGLPAANGVLQSQLAQVAPEKVDHYELGAKTQFWDRRVTLNLAAFWTEIHDYQAVVNNSSTSTLRGYLANAPRVRVRGIEGDFSIRPSARLNLYANGAWTDGRYIDFPNAPCPPELSGGSASPASCDISGQWLPGISRVAISYGGEANAPVRLAGHAGEAYLGIDASTRSRFSSSASRSIYTDVAGYTLLNLRAGFRTDAGFNLFAWLRNALDARYFDVLATTPGNTGLIAGNVGDPRTYGVTLGFGF